MAILSGWKEIAKHFGHGVRTVQRWEVVGLPVHRPKGTNRSAVIAFTEELDVWSHASPVRYIDEIASLKVEVEFLKAEVRTLKEARGSENKARGVTANIGRHKSKTAFPRSE